MIEHLRYRRLVDAFVDGELEASLAKRIGLHATLCPWCGRDAALTQEIKNALGRRAPRPDPARTRAWAKRNLR